MITVNRLATEQAQVRAELLKAARTGQIRKRVMPAVLKDTIMVPVQIDKRVLRFTISTPTVDRAMDVVNQMGWDLAAYRKNPVVLLEHGFNPVLGFVPIGRCTDIVLSGKALQATVAFDPEDMPVSGPYAEMALRKTLAGSFGATSVGFRPIEFDLSDDDVRQDALGNPGFDFIRQELTEFSLVAVPCNPDCGPDYVAAGPAQALMSAKPGAAKVAPLLQRKKLPASIGYLSPRDMSREEVNREYRELQDWAAKAGSAADQGERANVFDRLAILRPAVYR